MTRSLIAAGMLAAAGTAHAAPMIEIVQDSWSWAVFHDVGLNIGPAAEFVGADGDGFLQSPGMRGASFVADSGDLGANQNGVASGIQINSSFNASSGFSIQTRSNVLIDMAQSYGGNGDDTNYAESRAFVGGTVNVRLTEDALVRIRIDGFNDVSSSLTTPDELWGQFVQLSQQSGDPSLSPLFVGTNNFVDVPLPLDITVNLAAGEYSFFMNNESNSSINQLRDGFFRNSELNLSFQIVPAPGAAALFGLAGLAATRRRRA